MDSLDSGGGFGWARTSRPRVNSAIDVAGFLSQVFDPRLTNRSNRSRRGEEEATRDRGEILNYENPRKKRFSSNVSISLDGR